MAKFKLGPLQKEWVKMLRKHKDHQIDSKLGEIENGEWKACCLGLACMILNKKKKITTLFQEGTLKDLENVSFLASFKRFRLRDDNGSFKETIDGHDSLVEMNDAGVSWEEIANVIEKNPDLIFTKSV